VMTESGALSVDVCRRPSGGRRQETRRYLQGQRDRFQFRRGKDMTREATTLHVQPAVAGLRSVRATMTGQRP
jgi:hypothetical protein